MHVKHPERRCAPAIQPCESLHKTLGPEALGSLNPVDDGGPGGLGRRKSGAGATDWYRVRLEFKGGSSTWMGQVR